MIRHGLAVAALALGLAACGEEWQGTGRIVEHRYDDPDTYTTGGYFIMAGKTMVYIAPITHYEQERFLLAVQDVDGNTHEVTVHKGIWDRCVDGRVYDTETQEC